MRRVSSLLLGGMAALVVAGSAVAADNTSPWHEITVQLPGGGVEHIQYTGKVAPKVVVAPAPFAIAFGSPFWSDPAFANLERVSAEMDQQMDAMFRAAFAGSPVFGANGLNEAVLGKLPAGANSYSMVVSSNGTSYCSRSVETTIAADGEPHTVSHQSGNCSGGSVDRTSASDNNASTIKYETNAPAAHATRTAL